MQSLIFIRKTFGFSEDDFIRGIGKYILYIQVYVCGTGRVLIFESGGLSAR
jgi:hypothetical protein